MKWKVLIIALVMPVLAIPSVAGVGFESLLFENFESISPPALPPGWLILNPDGDAGVWGSRAYGGVPWGKQCMRYAGNVGHFADDWIFTSGVTLTSGELYDVKLQARVSTALQPYWLVVYAGMAQDPAGMTETIISIDVTWEDYQELTGWFVAPLSGTYYLGVHASAPANPHRFFVDDIHLLKEELELNLDMGMVKTLFVDPPTYTMADDTISAFITMENTGPAAETVNTRFAVGKFPADTEIQFTVMGPDGVERPIAAMFSKSKPVGVEDFQTLDPDSTAGKVVNLWNWYEFDMIGDYTIWATYRNYSDPGGLGAWMGELQTDPVVITVN